MFAYGATGSGKTYTMLGTQTEIGIMPRSVSDLFKILQNIKNKEFKIQISYIEIYNEEIRDLLANREELKLHEDPVKGVIIQGVKEISVENIDNFYDLLYKGNQKRTVGKTNANEASSRSHALLKINIENKDKEGPNSSNVTCGRFILVDLAGSEKTNSTITNNNLTKNAIRQQEGAKINQSLLNLGICINALASKSKFIPWRNSKLTHILKDCIGGNSKIVMISTISPSIFCVDETFNTLNYSNRAKNITTIIKKNVINVVDRDSQVSKYRDIISNLTAELEEKRNQLAVITNNKYLLNQKNVVNNNVQETGPNLKMDKLTKEITSHFNEELRVKNEILEMQRNISNLINNLKEKEFNLYKLLNKQQNKNNSIQNNTYGKRGLNNINSNLNMNSYLKEKDLRANITKINDQIQNQKTLLTNKEAKYNELVSKRTNLENAIGKFGNSPNLNSNNNAFVDNAQNFSALQYLYHSFILEINNLENDFARKQNTNEIVSKDIKINKLIEQLKIRDEYIQQEKKALSKKKIKFFFEGEKDIKKLEDLNIDKSFSLPFIIQQDNSNLRGAGQNLVSQTLNNTKRISLPLNNNDMSSRHRVNIMSNGQLDYSSYSNPNIIMEKKVIRTKTNEIMNKTRKNQLSELKLNMLNDQYKNSRVMYVNKRNINNRNFQQDDNVITFDTRKLNKSQSFGSISHKSQNDSLNNSNFGKSGIFNYKEREIDNKIKRVMIGKKKASPYLK